MRFLKHTITIISQIVILIIFVLWYTHSLDYEPLIGIIATFITLITSLISKTYNRPRIELHHKQEEFGSISKGFTKNNPILIKLSEDVIEHYLELSWSHKLEIRNNSSKTAYSINIKYLNIPPNTIVKGEIGKIEPLMPYEMKTFEIKFIQNIIGTNTQIRKYLNENIKNLTKDIIIIVNYKDEYRSNYYTKYNWSNGINSFPIFIFLNKHRK